MLKNKIIYLVLLCVPTLSIAGGSIDLSVSKDAVRFEHDAIRVDSEIHFTVGGIYNKPDNTYLVSSSFNVVDQTSLNRELIGAIGVKGYIYQIEESAFSVGLGGFFRYRPTTLSGFCVEGLFYYSPNIMTFNKTKSMHELVARVNYQIHNRARVFVGYNHISATFNDTEVGVQDIDNSFNVGFRLNY
ncbi:YfaZ family outer membrane protein [Marinicellulosiphila megalodicopiae]|uniref:YfaZ family outer membrane protein n=1 Tax=Marinicellulosiphila megalodicopiae TaxID=2724896 RepID=UPI003BB15FE0